MVSGRPFVEMVSAAVCRLSSNLGITFDEK